LWNKRLKRREDPFQFEIGDESKVGGGEDRRRSNWLILRLYITQGLDITRLNVKLAIHIPEATSRHPSYCRIEVEAKQNSIVLVAFTPVRMARQDFDFNET
jgi:hypothetical protein